MPESTENTALHWIQQEIQDVMERERELRRNNSNNNNTSNNNSGTDDDNISHYSEDQNDGGEQREDRQVIHNGNGNIHYRHQPLSRALSTSVLDQNEEQSNGHTKPSFRRFVSSHPSTKGLMHRFLKNRGKMQQVVAALNGNSSNNNNGIGNNAQINPPAFNNNHHNIESYEIPPPKIEPGQKLRKGFVSAEEKIKRDIAETFKRETELKTLRQSQGNLASLDDDELDAPLPNYMGGMRASRSMAQLCNSDEHIDEPVAASAPSSLRPARSLAQLCDASEDEVVSPQSLIMRFQQMIFKNEESKRK